MCRIVAYVGTPALLDDLLLRPAHGLLAQARKAHELVNGDVCGDGFGVAWYSAESAAPATYRTDRPLWNDMAFPSFAGHVRSPCVIANVRAASRHAPASFTNTQPFSAGGALALVHNGELEDFHRSWLRDLRRELSPTHEASITGASDSEHLFALMRERLEAGSTSPEDVMRALRRTFAYLARCAVEKGKTATLNTVVASGTALVAARHALHTSAPTLYVLHGRGPGGEGTWIASEPLTPDEAWHEVPDGSFVVADGHSAPRILPIARPATTSTHAVSASS
jgi:ergothioneine biosynthesis protein EgtC